jgi:hypothetical protein
MSKKVEGFLMNAEGSSFDKTPEGGLATVPFRPYFVAGTPNQTNKQKSDNTIQSILFDSNDSSFAISYEDKSKNNVGEGGLLIEPGQQKVKVTSTLRREADVYITNIAGIAVANFTVQPGETIEKPLYVAGVYIIRADGGKYQKKLVIK